MTMANWFYYYDNDTAEKKGLFNLLQIKDLAAKGTIKKDTIVETEEGKQGKAEKISSISFSATAPQPNSNSDLHFDPARPFVVAVPPKTAGKKAAAAEKDS
jgi:hypothetical protein